MFSSSGSSLISRRSGCSIGLWSADAPWATHITRKHQATGSGALTLLELFRGLIRL